MSRAYIDDKSGGNITRTLLLSRVFDDEQRAAIARVPKRRVSAAKNSDIVPNAPGQQLLQVHCRALTERIFILRYPRIAGLSS